MTKRQSGKGSYDREYLEKLIEEAIIDFYNEHEQAVGMFTKIEEELDLPFRTRILGVDVTVIAVEQEDDGLGIAAVCERDGERQHISLSDLPLPAPPPEGAEWIAAYRLWARHQWSPDEDEV